MDLVTQILTLLIGFALFAYYLLHRRFTYWERRNVPHIKPEFIHGNSRGIGKDFSSGTFFKNMYNKLKGKGPLVGVYVSVMPMAIATDLDLIKTILVKDFDVFTNRGLYYNKEDDPTSAHLASVEDEEWKSLRNKITPTFTSGKMKMMFPIIVDVADRMVKAIAVESNQGESVEIKDVASRFTTDVIAEVAFGIECHSLEDKHSKLYKMGQKSFGDVSFWKRTLTGAYPDLARKLHVTTSNKEVVQFFENVIQQNIKYRQENNVQRNDFMSLLIKMMNESTLNYYEALAQSFVFFLAGYETSASTMTFCIYELAQHPEIQQKARESVIKVLEKHDGKFTYEAIADMQFVEQCVKEALRIHSPASGTRRIAKRDYKVPNTDIVIEKGMSVIIPANGIHFDPDIYPDPYKYNPDRFAPEEIAKRHNFSFLPFGEGPRVCIGERFAIVEIKLALAKVLTNYEFTLDHSKTPVPLEYLVNRLLLTPSTGINIFVNKL
ncbi:hypothetical protein ACKWTF_016353 [Chironomus riparius]